MFSYLAKKRPTRLQKGRRRKEAQKYNRTLGRSLRHESLEDRRVLALVGVGPLADPVISYDNGGTTSYDSTSDAFSVSATPLGIDSSAGTGFFFTGTVDIDIVVDDTGTLVGGTPGDDFVITGDVDIDGDFVVDETGVLLTGEILQFGSEDSGGTTDAYDFRFAITGGALTTNALTAGAYAGKDLGITLTSELSDFTGDFTVDFSGAAKGDIGTIDPVPSNPDIEIEKLTNGVDADNVEDAVQVDPGDLVVFTYQVTNTGDVPFDFDDVVVVDDAGTPGDMSDDVSTTSGDIVFLPASDVGGDGILSPGETWQYEYATVAQDLESPSVVFDFSGSSPLDGPDGNIRTYTSDGVSVNVSAFSRDKDTDVFSTAYLGSYSGGLGVTDNTEGSGSGNKHTVDNAGQDNYVLFEFDQEVIIDSAFLGYVVDDSDITVWIGNATDPFNNHLDLDSALLSSLGFTEMNLGGSSTRLANINAGQVSGNVLVIAAKIGHQYDAFKIEKLKTQPTGGFYKNTAVVTVPGAEDSDCSHYENPDEPTEVSDGPKISYNNGGTVSYDADSDLWSLDATPLTVGDSGFFFSGDVMISAIVDDTGSFVAGIGGDDFVLLGEVDLDGDFVVDNDGVLLTGEVIDFSSFDSGGSTDTYEVRIAITGGLLSHLYAGSDLFVEVTSENSSFAGDYTVDFAGGAKGQICAVDPVVDVMASIGNYFFIDTDHNGLQNSGDFGVNGVVVNLLNDQNMVIASTVTADDGNGNAGFYLFYNLQAGDYIVEFEVPEGVQFTTKDAGDDNRDSDVNVATGRTDVISVADGEHRRDIDAGVKATVEKEEAVYTIEDFFSKRQKKKAGKITGVDIQYSEGADELYVSIDFKEHRGRLTDGYTFVLTSGEWPAGTEDKFAMFYFDADVYGRHGGPVLSVYGYNGKYNGQSYRDSDGDSGYDPDQIATSKDNSSGWVKELDVDTYRQGGRWYRTMSFRIVASTVNDHVPLQNGAWEGAMMDDKASFSIDTYDRLYTKYNHDGYLKKWYACYHGWMDVCGVHTTCEMQTVEVPIDECFDEFGWEVTELTDASISDGDPPQDADDDDSDLEWEGSVDVALEQEFA